MLLFFNNHLRNISLPYHSMNNQYIKIKKLKCNVFQFPSKTMWNNGTGRVEEKVQVQGQGDLEGTLVTKIIIKILMNIFGANIR